MYERDEIDLICCNFGERIDGEKLLIISKYET